MPVLAVLAEEEEPPPPPPPGVEIAPRVRAWWTGGNGDKILLTDCPSGLDWLKGRSGEDLPPFEFTEDAMPDGDQPAAILRGVRGAPRVQTLPLVVHSRRFTTFRAVHQRLVRALNPLTGDGRLTYLQPDGTERWLTCRYNDGAQGGEIQDPSGFWYRLWPVQFRAVDPWWSSAAPDPLVWGSGSSGGFFPILPVTLTSSNVLGSTTAVVQGDVRTWGVWTITGPANGATILRNVTLDRQVELNLSGTYELEPGDTAIVDMRPGQQRIVGPDGSSWWGARVGVPQMWHLDPGTTAIELSVAGATGATGVQFEYTPRWLTA
jgi:hypothetical protein